MTAEPVPFKDATSRLRDARPVVQTDSSLRLDELVAQTEAMHDRLDELSDAVEKLRTQQERTLKSVSVNKAAIATMRGSLSWRLTGPFRVLGRLIGSIAQLPKRVARRALVEILKSVRANPRFKPIFLRLLGLAPPPLRARIVAFATHRGKKGKARGRTTTGAHAGSPFKAIEANPAALAEWKRLLRTQDLTRP